MHRKTLLAYITGTVDQALLLRNAYLVTEHRILRNPIKGRLRLSDGERMDLADLGQKLGKQAWQEVAARSSSPTPFSGSAHQKAACVSDHLEQSKRQE